MNMITRNPKLKSSLTGIQVVLSASLLLAPFELAHATAGLCAQSMTSQGVRLLSQVDAFNRDYFLSLLAKNANSSSEKKTVLFDPSFDSSHVGEKENQELNIVYPTAVAPEKMMREVPVVNYSSLREAGRSGALRQVAKKANVYIAKMQAGTGSSVIRNSFVARWRGLEVSEVKLGAKGTDLLVPALSTVKPVSIAEAQILQASTPEAQGFFNSVHWVDLVSPETAKSIDGIWKGKSFPVVREQAVFQYNMPTVDISGNLTANRVAPAGHGLFGYYSVKSALETKSETKLETKEPSSKILILSNGEDLSGSADPLIIGHMLKENIPVIMVTTDKTEIDLKGGQIAVAFEGKTPVISIIEQAQAEASQQKKYFEDLGLRPNDRKAMFNTNMVLVNESALAPLIQKVVAQIGEKNFFELIGPNLIPNWKTQVDKDGVERKYLQLEGAMGSLFLNLDRYFRIHEGRSVVSFVNIDRQYRTRFFAPIKTAFDYYMQFYSDRFIYDEKAHRLQDQRPGFLPAVKLADPASKDKFYADVDNILGVFKGTRIVDLDQLNVEGRFDLSNVVLKGKVSLINKTAQSVKLSELLQLKLPQTLSQTNEAQLVFENIEITISDQGVTVRSTP